MSKEIPYIHYVRVLACIMVVMLHCLPHPEPSTSDYYFTVLVQFFTRPCVPLFFMVSGVLLLPYNDNNIWHFYRKRLPKIFFPLLAWGAVYAILPCILGLEDEFEMLSQLIAVPLTYPTKIGGILWFMYIILGIYMIIPFINPSVFDNKSSIRVYIGLWLLSSIIMLIQCYHHQLLGVTQFCDVNMLIYFSGYLGYLFLGKYIHQNCVQLRYRKMILTIIPLIYALSMLSIFLISDQSNALFIRGFLSIPAIIMSASFFLLIKLIITQDTSRCYSIIKKISKMSYGIYLSHMMVFSLITNKIYKLGGGILQYSVVLISTFVAAYIISVLLSKLPFSKFIIGV